MRIDVKRLTPTAKLPTIAYEGDLGYDLYADEDVYLSTGDTKIVRTGVAVEMYEAVIDGPIRQRYGAVLKDRSSMATKGIITSGGVIDAGYRGEILVPLTLLSSYVSRSMTIRRGDKIAQMIPILAKPHAAIYDVKELTESERGEKKHGSSGR